MLFGGSNSFAKSNPNCWSHSPLKYKGQQILEAGGFATIEESIDVTGAMDVRRPVVFIRPVNLSAPVNLLMLVNLFGPVNLEKLLNVKRPVSCL